MITDEYKKQLRQTRERWKDWGSSAPKNCDHLVKYLNKHANIKDVLDFGCGTGSLKVHLTRLQQTGVLREGITIHEYDPSRSDVDKLPTRTFDLIISLDVLEHVEPEELSNTLQWMAEHAPRQYHHIDCNDGGGNKLPDGRDVHLIIEPPDWWYDRFAQEFHDYKFMEVHVHHLRRRKRFPRTSTTVIMEYSP